MEIDKDLKDELPLLNLLRQVFLAEPTKEMLAGLAELNLPFEETDNGLTQMIAAVRKNRDRLNPWAEELKLEFSRLFIGPLQPPAIPFASFYLSEQHWLMSKETLEVRKKYLEAGVSLKNLYQTPDDHVGIELEFLYHLTGQAIQFLDAGNHQEAEKIIESRNEFIREHMALWIPSFVDRILEATEGSFYRGAAILLREVIGGSPC